jgi:hypothetical protein
MRGSEAASAAARVAFKQARDDTPARRVRTLGAAVKAPIIPWSPRRLAKEGRANSVEACCDFFLKKISVEAETCCQLTSPLFFP